MSVPTVASAGPVFVTERSVFCVTVVFAVDVSSPLFVSVVVVLTFAMFEIVPVALLAVEATSVNVAVAPAVNDAFVQVTVVVPLQLNVGPLFCVTETNVVPAGSVSVSTVFAAAFAPRFCTVIVQLICAPALSEAGPVFVTETSVTPVTVAEVGEVLLLVSGAALSLEIVA